MEIFKILDFWEHPAQVCDEAEHRWRHAQGRTFGGKPGFVFLNIIYRLVHYITRQNVVQRYHIDMANQISLFDLYIIYHIFKEFVDRPLVFLRYDIWPNLGSKFSMCFIYELLRTLQLCHPIHTLQRGWLDFGWFASHTFHLPLMSLDFTTYLTYYSILTWPISAREIIGIFTEIFKYCT